MTECAQRLALVYLILKILKASTAMQSFFLDQTNFINLAFCWEGCHGNSRTQTRERANATNYNSTQNVLTLGAFPL